MPSVDGPITILVVDDEHSIRSFVCRILTASGYHVIEAADGAEALAVGVAHDGPVHLLLTDIIMPKINGLILAERLSQARPELSVLYVSGFVERSILAAKYPDCIVLQKPFTPEVLIDAVQQSLARAETTN